MLLDASQIPPDTVVDTDICIVGGGAAGITLAREFLGQSTRVCLLESGGLQPEPETQTLYKGDIVGHSYYDLETARLRYFGGTSNHWAGNCRALSRIDFEERDWVPHSGWPFDVQHLTPFYERAQKILQIGPFAYEAKDWATPEAGPLQFADDAVITRVTQFSPPTRFGVAYGEEIKNATNVTAYLHANLVDIETNESNQSVTRLAVATLAGARFSVKAKHYVLATGGIENARLLLCANRVQKTGLGNEHGLVGRFFMEHLSLDVGLFLPSNQDLSRLDFYEVPDRRLGQVVARPPATKAYLAFSEAVQRRDRITNVTATLNRVYLPPSHESPGYLGLKDLMSGATENGFWQDLRNVIADFDSMASGMYWKQFERDRPIRLLTVHVQAEQAPNPESRVFLGTERDPLGMPRVKLDWRMTPLDVSSLRRVPEILGVQFGRSGLGRLKVIIPAEDAKLVASVGGDWHHMGTTRMHRDPKQGVVDADCRVHGIRNLFIAGSSVFPTGGHSVPTLTIVAMSVRLADHLKQVAAA